MKIEEADPWRIFWYTFTLISVVNGETTWVWNNNNRDSQQSQLDNNNNGRGFPSYSFQSANFGQTNFGRDRESLNNGRKSIFPDSPSGPYSPSATSKDNSALPADSIRVVNGGNSEARLIPGAANFVSNALQTIAGGTAASSSTGGGGGGGGLLAIGGNLIGSIFQSVPQLAGSAFEILLGRPSKGNSGSSTSSSSKPSGSSGAVTLPASGSSFPILSPGGGGSGGSFSRPSGGSSLPSAPSSSGSGNCKCIPLNSCFLPGRPGGSCAGGNIMCCQTDTRLGTFDGSHIQNTRDTKDTKTVRSPTVSTGEIRIGLLENIAKGTSNVVDDALDFLLARYYTEEDQQRLATRVLKSG